MRYETSVEIAAEPEKVWATWTDVERWSDWTPSVTWVRRLDAGGFAVGSRARVKQPGMRSYVWEVTQSEPGRSFVWECRVAGTRMVAGHWLESRVDGRVTARLTIDHTGALAGLLGKLAGGRIRGNLQAEANGIKRHCEMS
jgi:uncharacterized protein YndB with AHSA1/START domain